MTVLVAAVLGVVVGLLAGAYWRQVRDRRRRWYRREITEGRWRDFGYNGRPSLASRLRWYTLR